MATRNGLTVGELIDRLMQYDHTAPVTIRYDSGYGTGPIVGVHTDIQDGVTTVSVEADT